MKKNNQFGGAKTTLCVLLILLNFIHPAIAQYTIVVNGPSEICGTNTTNLSINPAPTGLTVNWYKNNNQPPFPPYYTGPVLSSPETGYWTAEIITSVSPFPQSVITPAVLIRTNQIYIESPFGTGSCTTITIDENASYVANLPLYDFYQWKKNGVSIPGANSFTYGASSSGTYTCSATLACGTGNSNPLVLTIENAPSQKTVSASGALTFCQGGSVTLSITPTAGLTYQWQKNNVNIPGATSTSYVATQSGTYKCREISVNCGSISSTSKVVTVNPLPAASTLSAASATTFCAGGSVLLSGNSTGGTWSIGGGTGSTLNASTSGDYYVTNSTTCGTVTSNHILVTVNPQPVATISGLASAYNCMDAPVVLSGSPAGGVFSGLGVSGNNFNPNTVGTNGSSAVSYNYYAAPNCTSAITLPVSVSSAYNCIIPQNVSVSQIAKKTAIISWNGSAAPSFKIRYRKTGTTNYLYKNISWSPCSATSAQLTGLISNTSYTVDVKAVCSSGSATYSNPITFRTLLTNPIVPIYASRQSEDENNSDLEENNFFGISKSI